MLSKRHRHRVVSYPPKIKLEQCRSTKLGVSQKWGVSLQTFTKIHQIKSEVQIEETIQFKLDQIGFITVPSLWADELALLWGINPCSVLPHGMCLRRLSITRTTLVETLRLLEVVELVDWLVRWVWLGSQQGKLLVRLKKKTGQVVHFCTMKCHKWSLCCFTILLIFWVLSKFDIHEYPWGWRFTVTLCPPKQAYVAGLYLLLPEHYNHFSVLKILIPWQTTWKSELPLLTNMSQAEKKKHNMSQGDEIFQLGVVIQECQFFFWKLCVCVNCVKTPGAKNYCPHWGGTLRSFGQ